MQRSCMVMKFLWECVSCCAPSAVPAVQTTSPPPAQENRGLVRFACEESERLSCRKRGKLGGSRSGSVSASHWKPSLCAISEDRAVSVVPGKAERQQIGSEKKRQRKIGSKARTPVLHHGDYDFRQTGVPMVIPAFSPMGFFC